MLYRILYVDDEPDLLEIARLFLEQSGQFSVDTITSAPAALALLDTTSYDAVISDFLMPGMDGIAFLKALRSSGKTIPFILFTGRGREEVVIQAINNGVDAYIQKGGDPEAQFAELSHRIRAAVARRRAEQSLRESEERFRNKIQNSSDMIRIIDPHRLIAYSSPSTLRLFGYDPAEMIGKDPLDYVHPDDRNTVRDALGEVFAKTNPGTPTEYRIRHKDGHYIDVEAVGSNLLGIAGIDGVVTTTRHITERKEAEEALRHENHQLDLLTGITRHDVLNKITVILGNLKIAERKCPDPALIEYLEKIRAATNAIRTQIEFTRIYRVRGTNEPQWVELDTILPRSHVPAAIILHVDLQGVAIFADPMLGRIFFNLLDNTLRHGQRVTEIRVSSQRSGEDLVVIWEDNGIGIPAGEKERIFERGFGKNTGLGMFLIREILSLTGITITETGLPGTGARFTMVVPKGGYRIAEGKPDPA